MKLNDYIEKQLKHLVQLDKKRQQTIKTIKNTTYRRVGSYQLPVTDEDKDELTNKTNRLYDSRINAIYDNMNRALEKAGHETLINSFERG